MDSAATIFHLVISFSAAKAMCAHGFLWAKLDQRANDAPHGTVSVADHKW
jgi:hypothetical protein